MTDRRPAPHVQAAVAQGAARASAQAKATTSGSGPGRPLAAHVERALGGVAQAREASPVNPGPAAHVQRALDPHPTSRASTTTTTSPSRPPGASRAIQPASASSSANSQSTSVTLRINGTAYAGKSSGQHGHAEMDALHKFIVDMEARGRDPGQVLARSRNKTVQCEDKPVCVACAFALKSLGVGPLDDDTVFGDQKSGGVSWGASMKVKALLGDAYEAAEKLGAK